VPASPSSYALVILPSLKCSDLRYGFDGSTSASRVVCTLAGLPVSGGVSAGPMAAGESRTKRSTTIYVILPGKRRSAPSPKRMHRLIPNPVDPNLWKVGTACCSSVIALGGAALPHGF
jgi:hypothetical protein